MGRDNFAIQKGTMGQLYGEGTGSLIVSATSHSYRSVPRIWKLLNPAPRFFQEGRSGTSGSTLVLIKNQVVVREASVVAEFDLTRTVVRTPSSILAFVRNTFCLNVSETAEILGITRQTTYQWMGLTSFEDVRSSENRNRLKQLYYAAKSWGARSHLNGRWLHELLPSGNTVFELLKASSIDLEALAAAHDVLAASTASRQREEGKLATSAAIALAEAFAGLGAGRKSRRG